MSLARKTEPTVGWRNRTTGQQDERDREWLLERLDFIRSLVESGADCALEDCEFTAHDSRRVVGTTFSFYEDVCVAHHRSRRQSA